MAADENLKNALASVTKLVELAQKGQPESIVRNSNASLKLIEETLFGDRPVVDQRSSIQSFFQAIGDGLKAAQESLDSQSLQYIANRPAFAPETMFRVPKVSANLKLGMTKSSERGFDFIIIDKSEQESEVVEQEISFDIVAAPPPPDALEAIQDLPLGQIIASNSVDRGHAQARLADELDKQKKIASDNAEAKKTTDLAQKFIAIAEQMNDEDRFRHVLIHRTGQNFIMISVPSKAEIEPGSNFEFGILSVPVEPESEASVDTSGLTKTDTRNRLLMEILVSIADRQAEILGKLGRK